MYRARIPAPYMSVLRSGRIVARWNARMNGESGLCEGMRCAIEGGDGECGEARAAQSLLPDTEVDR